MDRKDTERASGRPASSLTDKGGWTWTTLWEGSWSGKDTQCHLQDAHGQHQEDGNQQGRCWHRVRVQNLKNLFLKDGRFGGSTCSHTPTVNTQEADTERQGDAEPRAWPAISALRRVRMRPACHISKGFKAEHRAKSLGNDLISLSLWLLWKEFLNVMNLLMCLLFK